MSHDTLLPLLTIILVNSGYLRTRPIELISMQSSEVAKMVRTSKNMTTHRTGSVPGKSLQRPSTLEAATLFQPPSVYDYYFRRFGLLRDRAITLLSTLYCSPMVDVVRGSSRNFETLKWYVIGQKVTFLFKNGKRRWILLAAIHC